MLDVVLDGLVAAFGRVLVLEVGFTSPSVNTEVSENILGLLANNS